MQKLKFYQIDAFANRPYEGNPAAVIPLEVWLDDEAMQNIATENNLSDTAFFVPVDDHYEIRWFTPNGEVDLCGHATLASAYVLFEVLGYSKEVVSFTSKSGILHVLKEDQYLMMDFPAQVLESTDEMYDFFTDVFGATPVEVYKSMDYLVVFDEDISNFTPDVRMLEILDLRGVIITSLGEGYDFISRFFAPNYGIAEDPVTGSAYTQLVPYWSERLEKKELISKQVSKRGGELWCTLKGDRVLIKGKAVKVIEGVFYHGS
ncbi:MAG: PhzF family phenazine biosynthesis protein [Epsilonproteobacteria bacterium]|nr:PhzF family phenazine biosynthesis protein [Campylobacterota bacterium]